MFQPKLCNAVSSVGEGGASRLLEVRDVHVRFGETRALDSAYLVVRPGEIHGLAGENGSGKSTLIKVLSGVLAPQRGEVTWLDRRVRFRWPGAAQSAGIATVFQEVLVVPEMSVRGNIFIGTDGVFAHKRSRSEEEGMARAAFSAVGAEEVDLERPVWTLSLAERQIVTIVRAIVRPWRLLVLDEATSALDGSQRDKLYVYLRACCSQGRSVLFTSHRMDEVKELADRVSVLRLGRTVGCVPMSDADGRLILEMMAGGAGGYGGAGSAASGEGRAKATVGRRGERAVRKERDDVLAVKGLALRASGKGVDLVLGRGEVFGVAGLEGQGQVEFAECLCGLRRPGRGSVLVSVGQEGWRPVKDFLSANRCGIAYVPRDRKREGLFYPLSTLDNFLIASARKLSRWGVLRRSMARQLYRGYAELLSVKASRPEDPVSTLSGGNQQKILLARWLATEPRVLVLNDPMRGVDAKTKEELYVALRKLAGEGLVIVLVSTEIRELLELCDRIGVFHDGDLVAVLGGTGTSEEEVVGAMFGSVRRGAAWR